MSQERGDLVQEARGLMEAEQTDIANHRAADQICKGLWSDCVQLL